MLCGYIGRSVCCGCSPNGLNLRPSHFDAENGGSFFDVLTSLYNTTQWQCSEYHRLNTKPENLMRAYNWTIAGSRFLLVNLVVAQLVEMLPLKLFRNWKSRRNKRAEVPEVLHCAGIVTWGWDRQKCRVPRACSNRKIGEVQLKSMVITGGYLFCVLQSPSGVQVSDSDEEPVSKLPRLGGDSSDKLIDDGSYFEVRPLCLLHDVIRLSCN